MLLSNHFQVGLAANKCLTSQKERFRVQNKVVSARYYKWKISSLGHPNTTKLYEKNVYLHGLYGGEFKPL